MVDGLDIPIDESREHWSELLLADGSVFRVKLGVQSVVRIEGRKDPNGNAVYVIAGNPIVTMVKPPDHALEGESRNERDSNVHELSSPSVDR